jgi:hypothetical protein
MAFVHIPKTAGATVTTMFEAAYSKDQVRGAGNWLRHPRATGREISRVRWTGAWTGLPVVVGHIPYGLFEKHMPPDTVYMTFLREPVDRVLSHYHRHVEPKARKAMSLEEALEAAMPDVTNLATRFLCGDPAPLGDLRAGALDDAKANLGSFAFVGIQERFEESVVLLQRTLGLAAVPYLNQHVSIDRPAVDEIPDELRSAIQEHNRLDMELYAFALELFEDALGEAGPGLEADVAKVRALSRDAGERAIQRASQWLERELATGATRPIVGIYEAAEADGVPAAALKHVIGRAELKKVKDPDGRKVLVRSESYFEGTR